MAASAKTRAKRHAKIRRGWKDGIPEFNLLDRKMSIVRILSYFSSDVDDKTKQKLVLDYWTSQGKNASKVKLPSGGWISQSACLAYLSSITELEDEELSFLDSKYDESVEIKKTKRAAIKKSSVQDHINQRVSEVISDIEGFIDDFCTLSDERDIKEYLLKSEVSSIVSKRVGEFFKPTADEVFEALSGDDPDLVEGYSNFNRRKLKKFHSYLTSIVDACNHVSIAAKVTRKPRVRKEKPASVVASKVQYLKEFELFGRSITPEKVVGATEVWCYNIKYRKLFRYVAQDGMTMTWKGTTLQNWNPDKSCAKTIRKPEEKLSGLMSMTKRPLNKMFNDINSVEAKVTGRFNDDTIIVGVF